MKLNKTLITISTIFVVMMSHAAFADSNTVFMENKENFVKTYKFLSTYQRVSNEKAFDQAVEAKEMIALAKVTLDVLAKGIPEGFRTFMLKTPDAKKLSFEAKSRHLKGYITQCETKLQSAKMAFIKKIEKRIGWIERSNNPAKAEKYFNEMGTFFTKLEKSYPNDDDVIAAKEKLIAEAHAKAGSLLAQHKAKVAAFTMLKDNTDLSDLGRLKEKTAEIFKGFFKTDPIRITIPYNWEKREEYALVHNKIQHRDFYATKGTIAYHDKAANKFYVKEMLIKKVEDQIGFLAHGDKFEILEKNINR